MQNVPNLHPPGVQTRSMAAHRKAQSWCSICGDADPSARPYACTHLFHTQCLLQWCAHENSCPICREFFNFIMCSKTGVLAVDDVVQHGSDSEE